MKIKHLLYLLSLTLLLACSEGESHLVFKGKLNQSYILQQNGFEDYKMAFLEKHNMSLNEFISLTSVHAKSLSPDKRIQLKSLRSVLIWPSSQDILQKVIPLSDVTTYMENTYGGTVGGIVCIAADAKSLRSMYDVYWGLRLDYANSKFKENGAGYAVIRFYSSQIDRLNIPYSPEMGGTITDPFPFGGGGFTTSKLGTGGIPEYLFIEYLAPNEGAELYECTTTGKEILRAIYTNSKWTTYEGETVTTKSRTPLSISPRHITYKGHSLFLRGVTSEGAHLFSFDSEAAAQLGMETYAKGEYRLIVPLNEIFFN